jgi:ADP-ribose pyrophosphatase YjhB (NUDIX family)
MQKIPKKFSTHTIGIVAAIIEKSGKILLVKENKPGTAWHNTWNQPAGWIEKYENPTEAAKREVREETGHKFTATHLLGIYSVGKKLTSTHPLKFVFTGNVSKNPRKIIDKDISEINWFLPQEIYKMKNELRSPDIKKMVKDYFAGKRYPLDIIHHEIQK